MNFQDRVWREALHDRLFQNPQREVQDEFVEPKDDQRRQPDGIEGFPPEYPEDPPEDYIEDYQD